DVGLFGHGGVLDADIGACCVAPEIEGPEVAAAEDDGFTGPGQAARDAAAKGAADAHAVLDDDGEGLSLIGEVPEEAGVAARGVELPQDPPVPANGGEGGVGMGR